MIKDEFQVEEVDNKKITFTHDGAIKGKSEDFLFREPFAKHLGNAMLNWREQKNDDKESLVVALYGEWGSGKTSVINLTKEYIDDKYKSDILQKPTIVDFNPWGLSEETSLTKPFFNAIARKLELEDGTGDKDLAKKLRYYADVISLAPTSKKTYDYIILLFLMLSSVLGITTDIVLVKVISIAFFAIVIILKFFLSKFASFYELRSEYLSKSINEAKNSIKNELLKRKKKIIVIVDDIDRLNQREIKQIFRLVRVNADFPNTLYLMSFDRNIVEKSLNNEQQEILGRDYLSKIIQVNFDIPFASREKIIDLMHNNFMKLIAKLPVKAQKYFNKEFKDEFARWQVAEHYMKPLFKNVRDIKRFFNSLEFNISQMYNKDTIEVNPIDFFVLEGIRIFAPDFYSYIHNNSNVLMMTSQSTTDKLAQSSLRKAFDDIPDDYKESIEDLMTFSLFPQVSGILRNARSEYGENWHNDWVKDQRICSNKCFDTYFNFIPGGQDGNLSRYEIEQIIESTSSKADFENIYIRYLGEKKSIRIFNSFEYFKTDGILQKNIRNILEVLFSYDEKVDVFALSNIMAIEKDKLKNFNLLKELIPRSKNLYLACSLISYQDKSIYGKFIPDDKMHEMQSILSTKLENAEEEYLLNHQELPFFLFKFHEWGKKTDRFIENVLADKAKTIKCISKFTYRIISSKGSDRYIGFKTLSEFFDLNKLKATLDDIKENNIDLYSKNKEIIDMFLNNYEKYLKDSNWYYNE